MDSSPKKSFLTIPGAIIIAGAIVALAVIWTHRPPAGSSGASALTPSADPAASIPAVTAADHILGNPNAPIKIVEYSDPSCPYCKMFNPVMVEVMDQYGPGGKVAWVYRHFPLDKPDADGNILHPNAGHEAQALECAASLGGNDKFWAYEKRLYSVTPSVTPDSPKGLDQKQLPEIAKYVGLDPVSFNECLTSGQSKTKIDQEYLDGINAGIGGTPYSILITPSGSKIPIVGAQDLATLKSTIDVLLADSSSNQ